MAKKEVGKRRGRSFSQEVAIHRKGNATTKPTMWGGPENRQKRKERRGPVSAYVIKKSVNQGTAIVKRIYENEKQGKLVIN